MDAISRFITWFQMHKAPVGMFLASLAGIIAGTGVIYNNDEFVHAAAVIGLIATALGGGGMMKSDAFYRERDEVVKTGVDRRQPAKDIPVPDLKKLVDKIDPDDKD